MTNPSIAELRELIDDLDSDIVRLLNERAETAVQLGKVKAKLSKEAYDPARERVVLEKVNKLSSGPLPKGSLESIYAAIITACREIQTD